MQGEQVAGAEAAQRAQPQRQAGADTEAGAAGEIRELEGHGVRHEAGVGEGAADIHAQGHIQAGEGRHGGVKVRVVVRTAVHMAVQQR